MSIKTKIRDFLQKYEAKIVLIIGLILVSFIAFEAGALKGQDWQKSPLIIEKSIKITDSAETAENCLKTQNLASEGTRNSLIAGESTENNPSKTEAGCAYIGSRNSDKYHAMSCSWATRIKPENRVCFSGIEDAKSKGYIPGSCLKN